ncbi:MAG: hypothetical protein IT439_02860 [Phycisphaerales bacterium]|nr:hypothetical protein [Phycisphaerales bacterium]
MEPRVPRPQPKPRAVLCPYCGGVSRDLDRCTHCAGFFDPLSRQASQNHMGPWFIRDALHPYRPGCSYETIRELAARKRLQPGSILRGPGTNQFWCLAKRTPGVAHLLGMCHNCQAPARADEILCSRCGASFHSDADRQHLGLLATRLLPGQAPAGIIAAASTPLSAGQVAEADEPPPVRTAEADLQQQEASMSRRPAPDPLVSLLPRRRSSVPLWIVFMLTAPGLIAGAYWLGLSNQASRRAENERDHADEFDAGIKGSPSGDTDTVTAPTSGAQESPDGPEEGQDEGSAAPIASETLWNRLEPLLHEDSASSLAAARDLVRLAHEQGRLTAKASDELLAALTRRENLKQTRELP